ncbi:MAG: alpha/beta hydrolase [Sporolactobacillus sp.]
MNVVTSNNCTVHYFMSNWMPNRPTLLLIHGSLTDSSIWYPLLDSLGQSVNWIIYDRCGHGDSEYLAETPTIEQMTDEACSVLRAVGIDKVHVVGCGLGSTVAFELARKHPNLILSVVLIASVLFLPEKDFAQMFCLFKQLAELDPEMLLEKVKIDFFEKDSVTIQNIVCHSFRRIHPDRLLDEFDWLLRTYNPAHFNFANALSELAQPALVLHGIHDRMVSARVSALFSACIPDSRWFPISHAAHYPQLEQPNQTAALLLKFIYGIFQPITPKMPYQHVTAVLRTQTQKALQVKKEQDHVLQVCVLQSFKVLWNGEPIEGKWNQRGAKDLLLYLSMNHGRARRVELIRVFFPYMPEIQARNHLRVRLSHLHKIFKAYPAAEHVLQIDEENVMLRAHIQCDLIDLKNNLTLLSQTNLSIQQRSMLFFDVLKRYNPSFFSIFQDEWVDQLIHSLEIQMGQILQKMLPILKKNGKQMLIRHILQSAHGIEPYDGYCNEWLTRL